MEGEERRVALGVTEPSQWPGMKPDRGDTRYGIYIPPWLLTLDVSAEAMMTWGAMAKLAENHRRLRGCTATYIGSFINLSKTQTRRAIVELRDAGVIVEHNRPGQPSDYAFRAPRPGDVAWSRFHDATDADEPEYWREW